MLALGDTTARRAAMASAALSIFVVGMAVVAFDFLLWNPFSLVVVIPALPVGMGLGETTIAWNIAAAVGSLVPLTVFFILVWWGRTDPTAIPRGIIATFFILFTVSIALAMAGWGATVGAVSLTRANALVAQSLLPPVVILLLGFRWREKLTFGRVLALYWVGGIWLAWSAVPWYGELI